MTTSEFLELLNTSGTRSLQFVTESGREVPSGYHITEVMNVDIDSVDCGGRRSKYSKMVVQLWNGDNPGADYIKATKALEIFDRVEQMTPMLQSEEIQFEWGDVKTPTSTYSVSATQLHDDRLEVQLYVPATQCKPAAELLSACCSGAPEANVTAAPCCV